MAPDLPDYVARNRAHWDDNSFEWVDAGRRRWQGEPVWGIWGVTESELGLLPDLDGKSTLEVGCGTGYVSAWLTRRGADAVGLDNPWRQLSTARLLQEEFNLPFPLIHGIGESLPFVDERFDLVISEYGPAIWSDPCVWIPEAARVLRPGGDLIFLTNSVLVMLCAPDYDGVPAEARLVRSQFGMYRFEWPDDGSVEFHLSHGDMMRLLDASGFETVDLIEIQAPEGPPDDRIQRHEGVGSAVAGGGGLEGPQALATLTPGQPALDPRRLHGPEGVLVVLIDLGLSEALGPVSVQYPSP